jgi:hypothetical protein
MRDGCRALHIVASKDGSATGVRLETKDGSDETLPGDLVIDASRRGALALSFPEETGRPRPEQANIGIDLTYATRTSAVPEGSRNWKAVVTIPEMPASSRTGYLVPIEGNRWIARSSANGISKYPWVRSEGERDLDDDKSSPGPYPPYNRNPTC